MRRTSTLPRSTVTFSPGALEGHFFTLFGIAVSAAETAVGIAIMINVYRNVRNIQTDDISDLKG